MQWGRWTVGPRGRGRWMLHLSYQSGSVHIPGFPANWQLANGNGHICLTIMSGNYRIGRKFALPIAKNAVMQWAKGGGAQRAVGGGLWVVRVNIVQSFINSNNNRHCTCKWKCENGKCSRERSFFFFNCAYLSVKWNWKWERWLYKG